jgi:ribokinase
VDGFPIPYFPVRYPFHGVNSTVSGVGYNLAAALTALGEDVRFLSFLGNDLIGEVCRKSIGEANIPTGMVRTLTGRTPQSVILFEPDGRRQIHVDLKEVQEAAMPLEAFPQAAAGCEAAMLCNINFARPLLKPARDRGLLIATDVHALSRLDDDYNRDWLEQADILFLSDEHLPGSPEDTAAEILGRFRAGIVVIGLGAKGALLADRSRGLVARFPAVTTRPVVNTIGAGDALFSCFVREYVRRRDSVEALSRAQVFASYKIGDSGGAAGFLSSQALNDWTQRLWATNGKEPASGKENHHA